MKILTKQGEGVYNLVEADSTLEATIDAIVKPVTGQPISSAQNWIWSALVFTGGICLGTAMGHKIPVINKLSPVQATKEVKALDDMEAIEEI